MMAHPDIEIKAKRTYADRPIDDARVVEEMRRAMHLVMDGASPLHVRSTNALVVMACVCWLERR